MRGWQLVYEAEEVSEILVFCSELTWHVTERILSGHILFHCILPGLRIFFVLEVFFIKTCDSCELPYLLVHRYPYQSHSNFLTVNVYWWCSSGFWDHVDLVDASVSEKHTVSILRLKMAMVCFSEMLASTNESTRPQNPEEHHHHPHHHENLKSH
jgi:hypothetical protein